MLRNRILNSSRRIDRNFQAGVSLIGVAILSFIVGVVALSLVYQVSRIQKEEQRAYAKGVAQVYAAELMEYFRSYQRGTDLLNYLGATAPTSGYQVCQAINFLNRSTGVVANPHALADGKVSNLRVPNRYYKVEIRDMSNASPSASVVAAACGQMFSGVTPLTTQQRVVVTVNLSWLGASDEVNEVSMSAVLPEN